MDKTILKIFSVFVLSAAGIATLLLAVNFLGFALVGSDVAYNGSVHPRRVLSAVSQHMARTPDGLALSDQSILPPQAWCIAINEDGNVIWSQNKPADIPEHYTLTDIARMTRWFLNDYPVYVQTADYGLLVLGLPKNTVGKYAMEYSMTWFDTLPQRILAVLLFNLCLAVLFACVTGFQLYRRLKALMGGIQDLSKEKNVRLKEKGIFKSVCRTLNQTAQVIARKNAALAVRDSARANWIAGISHDIRTPLSVITGYAQALAQNGGQSPESRKKAETILSSSIKISRLIADLNLISSIEYDMQPAKKQPVRLCPLLRRAAAELVNNGLPEQFTISLELQAEQAVVLGDAALLERAVFNLLNNAVVHNPKGCHIRVTADVRENQAHIMISDDGAGVPEAVLSHIDTLPKTTHGVGLPLACRIIAVHGGTFTAYNADGFTAEITLPL